MVIFAKNSKDNSIVAIPEDKIYSIKYKKDKIKIYHDNGSYMNVVEGSPYKTLDEVIVLYSNEEKAYEKMQEYYKILFKGQANVFSF